MEFLIMIIEKELLKQCFNWLIAVFEIDVIDSIHVMYVVHQLNYFFPLKLLEW
jgi:hypothetical protein